MNNNLSQIRRVSKIYNEECYIFRALWCKVRKKKSGFLEELSSLSKFF